MIDSLLNCYRACSKNRRHKNPILRAIYAIGKLLSSEIALLYAPIHFRLFSRNNSLADNSSKGAKVIVSLTSFPVRINTLWIVIESLLRQSYRADKIVLTLSKEQFKDKTSLPKSLLRLQSRGLEIKLIDGDIRSYKKFFYSMQRYADDIIITVDDDIIYPRDILSALIATHRDNPNSIIATRVRGIKNSDRGELLPYTQWRDNHLDGESKNYIQIGVGGVLYPPYSLYKDLLRDDLFLKLAPFGDDLWLFTMARLNDRSVRRAYFNPHLLGLRITKNVNLFHTNRDQNQNDVQIRSLREYYKSELGIDPFEYIEED